ncbi:MAG: hypothetical protein ACKVPJ_08105 [Chitinophagales bacterium]
MRIFMFIAVATLITGRLQAKENIGIVDRQAVNYGKLAAACNDATTQIDLDVNNVRARLLGAGDFWWDLANTAKYVIPKVDPSTGEIAVSSSFAGALWIGGIDAGGQLKIAAQTYRQSGNDFWPGPLDESGTVDDVTCNAYDRHWKVNRTEIDEFLTQGYSPDNPASVGDIPVSIREWPGLGNEYATGKAGELLSVTRDLAPFVDADFDGLYNPGFGDYPDIDGDQAIFWIYNDKGNIHTETGGDAIGLEIQAMAFGFTTNDEINDMTFYRYKVINFATTALDSVFFGQWVDSDVGCFSDDWVGCDVETSLGMCFNGDAFDEACPEGYGNNPPIFGTDFFQGPIKYIYDGGSIVDSIRLGMTAFLYYNNDFTTIGNPEVAAHYYGYLSGTWKDGSPFTFGGNGYGGSEPSLFMFPDDPSNPEGWSECTEGNTPADRRYLQSSGPFRLEPGAKNEVVVGAVWVRPPLSGGCNTTYELAAIADQKAQALFDNDFQLIGGPDAPDLTIRELDQEIILSLTNGVVSNNQGESYEEADPLIKSFINELSDSVIAANPGIDDSTYNFQGYKIFQLVNGQVSPSEYDDASKARLLFQCDLKDGVSKLINYSFDAILGVDVPTLMVEGADAGVQHTFQVNSDAFAEGNTTLINFKTYYFSVVAYAYNNFFPYDPDELNSQKRPYLEGRKNIKIYTAVPHIPDPENNGMQLNAAYGDGPDITKIEGRGNGGYFLELTDQATADILASNSVLFPTYKGRNAPVDVKVYDPVRLPAANFTLTFVDSSVVPNPTYPRINRDSIWWVLTNTTSGESIVSDFPISFVNEQVLPEWGLSVTVKSVNNPGMRDANPSPTESVFVDKEENNGFVGATLEFADPNQQWLSGVPDVDGTLLNWIRSGESIEFYADYPGIDDNQFYEGILGGTWGPTVLLGKNTDDEPYMPWESILALSSSDSVYALAGEIGIDLVLTNDKSKWSKAVVLNTGEYPYLLPDGSGITEEKLDMRKVPSVDQDGNAVGDGTTGYSWFPGYAIDVETGRRLNIMFGEDPNVNETGVIGAAGNSKDMLFNPSETFFNEVGTEPVYGGKHYIYIHKTTYDQAKNIHDSLFWVGGVEPGGLQLKGVFRNVCWASMPLLNTGAKLLPISEGLIPTETTVKIRVTKQFEKLVVTNENEGYPKYSFSTFGLAPTLGDPTLASDALDLINIVPNPYYAYSGYETSTLDNKVKITNLPSKCTITIYAIDGTLIRRFTRDVTADNSEGGQLNSKTANLDTSLDWDLKNSKNVPVASGMYLIHIDAGELGEKTLKWLGIMRPIDLDSF